MMIIIKTIAIIKTTLIILVRKKIFSPQEFREWAKQVRSGRPHKLTPICVNEANITKP